MEEYGFDLIFGHKTSRPFERQQLRGLLGLSLAQWKRATLDRDTVLDQTYPNMRFCPLCLEHGYHTAVLQLLTVRICPVHRCDLIDGCPNCGKRIWTSLNLSSLRFPFACPECKTALVKPGQIIDPPSLGPFPTIAKIARWYQRIADLPRVEGRPWSSPKCQNQWMSPPALLLLEFASRKRAPPLVTLDRQPLKSGTLLSASFGMRVPLGRQVWDRCFCDSEMDERRKRNIVLYRAYRRMLQKSMPGSPRLIRAFRRAYAERLDSSMDIPTTESLQTAKISAFALLLFRHTMEGWNGLRHYTHDRSTWGIVSLFSDSSTLKGEGYLAPQCMNSLLCSQCERDWLRDHFFFELIRGIFAEAVHRAREMVLTGYYFLLDLGRFESSELPYCLGFFNSEGRLEFWSLTLPLNPDRYRLEQQKMTCPVPFH